MSSMKEIFLDYYKKLNRIEKQFLIIFTIDVSIYSILLLTYLILTDTYTFNYSNFSLVVFPIFSGILTVRYFF